MLRAFPLLAVILPLSTARLIAAEIRLIPEFYPGEAIPSWYPRLAGLSEQYVWQILYSKPRASKQEADLDVRALLAKQLQEQDPAWTIQEPWIPRLSDGRYLAVYLCRHPPERARPIATPTPTKDFTKTTPPTSLGAGFMAGLGTGHSGHVTYPLLELGWMWPRFGVVAIAGYGQKVDSQTTRTSFPGAPFSGRTTKQIDTKTRALPFGLSVLIPIKTTFSASI